MHSNVYANIGYIVKLFNFVEPGRFWQARSIELVHGDYNQECIRREECRHYRYLFRKTVHKVS